MTQPTFDDVVLALRQLADPKTAAISARFFKTGPGEYGEGDIFLGVKVPDQRKVARRYADLSIEDAEKLLAHEAHECRLTGLLIWVRQFERGDDAARRRIYERYLSSTHRINNWDLVDSSAPTIVGGYFEGRAGARKTLEALARSESLWERRIAMLATLRGIKKGDPKLCFAVAKVLLQDPHDLIHKAVGWMLREVGERVGEGELIAFLKPRYRRMPRTMLRYAIEHFSPEQRKAYLAGSA